MNCALKIRNDLSRKESVEREECFDAGFVIVLKVCFTANGSGPSVKAVNS